MPFAPASWAAAWPRNAAISRLHTCGSNERDAIDPRPSTVDEGGQPSRAGCNASIRRLGRRVPGPSTSENSSNLRPTEIAVADRPRLPAS